MIGMVQIGKWPLFFQPVGLIISSNLAKEVTQVLRPIFPGYAKS
jgi:hypothetical protein